jgi:uncharacterized damage-inducible protein DinB
MANKQKVQYYRNRISNILDGNPWFVRPVFSILPEIHPALVYIKPNKDEDAHSLIDLLYHMITWTKFCLKSIQGDSSVLEWAEDHNWRTIDPKVHTWTNGSEELRSLCNSLLEALDNMTDEDLEKPVPNRSYNIDVLINGWIEHTIYHLGQIAYVKKWLVAN